MLLLLSITMACWLNVGPSAPATGDDEEFKKLVEQITCGDEDESAEAAERLIERVVGPVAEALGALESRPVEEQVRLRRVLARLSAALRVRLLRAELPPAERALFDEFAGQYPQLVERLFDDDYRRRKAALQQIPLEPNSGAGVLVVAKINDPDGDVAEAALKLAADLKDQIVVRGLVRYVDDSVTALKSGFFRPGEEELAAVTALFVGHAISVLGDAKAEASVPVIAPAVGYLAESPYHSFFDTSAACAALGKIGDERAVPELMKLLDAQRVAHRRYLGDRKLLTQTVGDAALLALLKIYRIEPGTLGFAQAPGPHPVTGFLEDEQREAAYDAFARWHKHNHDKPAAQRKPLTTQPVEKE